MGSKEGRVADLAPSPQCSIGGRVKGFRFGHGSHTGRIRERNEDNYDYDSAVGLWVVADGMGGVKGGDIASRLVAREVIEKIRAGGDLKSAIGQAHRAVLDAAQRGEGAPGMGSTVVVLKIRGLAYEIAWVGDSRAYRYSWHGRLSQLTRDHSLLQQLIDAGIVDKTETQGHPARNIICQAVGSTDDRELTIDAVNGRLSPGEQILLCTDGLSSEVSDKQIASILAEPGDEQSKVDKLIDAALVNGGSDNVTALLITVSAET